ncbi:SGNH/GDSL hydrolase family protein [Dyadobacter alkalitolerans]|uniref:SGNH/GDSL hydrolase family protein n=1 Tax=Dyadobacter alkalitolerans TaxID=492736 RepID=UPI00040A03C5|nr:GDSL-type esterase/lipase family protein [Dyadobacter alkalitolerans]
MKTGNWLVASLALNVFLIISICVFSYIYRDKIMQRFVAMKGNPTIVMYGNSITAQGKWTALLDRTDVLNNGLPGMSTYHFLQLLPSHVINLHPKICFVKGGINDITVGVSQEKMQGFYKAILDKIIENNIIPVVTLTVYEQDDPISKKEVDTLNAFLINYCSQHDVDYIDLNRFISDSTGLKAEYAVDKTHLNEKAYEIWAREIKKVLVKKGI